jgi:hypothetical protein
MLFDEDNVVCWYKRREEQDFKYIPARRLRDQMRHRLLVLPSTFQLESAQVNLYRSTDGTKAGSRISDWPRA